MQPISYEEVMRIVKNGKFYNPASTHYSSGVVVRCDYCCKNNLEMSLGYENYDLCIECLNCLTTIKSINIEEMPIAEFATETLFHELTYKKKKED